MGVISTKYMSRQIFRGASLARLKLNAARSAREESINVQFSGAEMMDSRQYRHTRVSLTTSDVSVQVWRVCQAIREMISGGNLLTGCNRFRTEEISLRTPCALVSRLSTCTVHCSQTNRLVRQAGESVGAHSLLIPVRQ